MDSLTQDKLLELLKLKGLWKKGAVIQYGADNQYYYITAWVKTCSCGSGITHRYKVKIDDFNKTVQEIITFNLFIKA